MAFLDARSFPRFLLLGPAHPLLKETSLSLGEFHGCGAFFVVVHHVIDARAYGIAPHHSRIVGLQQVGRRTHVPNARIKPEVVAVGVKDDWHALVDGCGHRVWGRGQNRTGFDPLPAWVFRAIPQPREREQLPGIDFNSSTAASLCPSAATRKIRLPESGTCEISMHRGARPSSPPFPIWR